MKKNILGFLLSTMLISVCGCGAGTTNTTSIETVNEEQIKETTKPVPEATREPSEEVATETETEIATLETAEPEQTEAPTTEPVSQYTYTDMSATMYAQQFVNVRDLPDTGGDKLGGLSINDEITVTGQCNETGWYRFDYDGKVAYVSNKYVGENKVEEQQQAPIDNGGSTSTASNSCPYPLWQPVDNGYSFTWYVIQPDPEFYTNGHFQIEKQYGDIIMDRVLANNVEWQYFTVLEWTYMGTYAEGDIYKQTWGISNEPDPWVNQ